MTVPLRKGAELAGIRAACLLGRQILDLAHAAVKPGVTTDEIDRLVSRCCLHIALCIPLATTSAFRLVRCVLLGAALRHPAIALHSLLRGLRGHAECCAGWKRDIVGRSLLRHTSGVRLLVFSCAWVTSGQ